MEGVVDGMKISSKQNFQCVTCDLGKLTNTRSRTPDDRATERLQLVHCDVAGPMSIPSREGSVYAINFVDDYSGAVIVYFLKAKSDAPRALERFLADMSPYGEVKRFRSDNAKEFCSREFTDILVKNRIRFETSAPYSPHQNGTAERMWRTLFEMARCLLIEANLPKKLWNYAVRTAAYIRNRCFCSRSGKTPIESLTGKKPDVSNMYVFGTVCYAYVDRKSKLDARCQEGIFIGYDPLSPAYLIYYSDKDDVKRSRIIKCYNKYPPVDEPILPGVVPEESIVQPVSDDLPVNDVANNVPSVEVENVEPPPIIPSKGRSVRKKSTSKYLDDYDVTIENTAASAVHYCCTVSNAPRSYSEAMRCPLSHRWQGAMDEEIAALEENRTYELTSLPPGKNLVGGRWVYDVKRGHDGEDKYKARYVAKGYSQVETIDYNETFSPTARMTSIRLLMQLVVGNGYAVHQLDFKYAYLQSNIDHEIFVQQPKGYNMGENLVWKLHKSLYGLKQSGRNWNISLNNFLVSLNFVQSLSDNCVYRKNRGESNIVIVVFVDDLIVGLGSIIYVFRDSIFF